MTVNVTAATGQLGGKIVDALLGMLDHPGKIIASVRSPGKATDLAGKGVSVRRADYEDPASMVEAFRGTDTLVLVPGLDPPPRRVVQHQNALDAARKAGVGRVVLSSFMGGALESPFVVSPFTVYSESSLRTSGLAWTILRNGMYADPLVPYVPELIQMGRIPYPAGDGRVSYVSRDDLARATAAASLDARHAGRVYTLTGPEALSIARVAEIVTLVTGKPVRYESATDEEFTAMCEMPGAPPYLARALTTLYHAVAQGFLEDVTDHVETITGQPPEDLESFLRRSL